jgi:hypothetical protein
MSALTFLDAKYRGHDGEYETWAHWLQAACTNAIHEGESFSGKRPCGNSGWEGPLDHALTQHSTDINQVMQVVFNLERYYNDDFC